MKKKGLSFKEKQDRMLKHFTTTKEVFNIKEVEKFSTKAGITPQSFKEVLDMLLADDFVLAEKIGAGNFYWSFPSAAYQIVLKKINDCEAKIVETDAKTEKIQEDISKEQEKRNDPERAEKLKILEELKNTVKAKEEVKAKLLECHPDRLKECNEKLAKVKEEANFYTDNVFVIKSWVQKKFPHFTSAEIDKNFNIPAEFDNI